ncbi:GIY-YIG nuclease family protein [Aggregatimonas sangjinii]|uniref:GIY-YIG nuclease family protein n=1 Tax=Aggregatimonas sangjinii TaxID=2583587 RepID=A0A5B7SZI1_9FLAO|nr:GIY-YIG nuclease family protein [Aggregatimonas sangjinii]QCX02234.1 GIY-YIG nuclease family protein [Aggregatimonas sangjinii]
MKFYFVYILFCSDGTYYTGMTNDLERRLAQHQSGHRKDSYTYFRRPVLLKWYLQCTSPSEAIAIEKQIKGWSHQKKMALIEENWKDLVEFSKNYSEHRHPKDRDRSSTGSD